MKEQPNLNYINQIAQGDADIRKELIQVVKTEFPEEKKDYYKSIKNKDFFKIEQNVHRIKHKISILGLEKSYKKANNFEHNLREHSLQGQKDFEQTLIAITNYIATI